MKLTPKNLIKNFDWVSFVTTLILVSLSLIMLYSIALGSDDAIDLNNFKKQIVFAVVSIAAYMIVAFFFDFRYLRRAAVPLYAFGVIVLIILLLFGTSVRGTTGWFVFGPLSIQPVEFIKIIAVIFMAHYLVHYAKYIHQFRYILFSLFGIGVYIALILLQPDFGSSMILVSLWLGLLLITGMLWKHIILLASAGLGLIAVLWTFIFKEYQKNRIRVFLDPTIDPLGTGYNVTQAIIAVGSGRLWGRGLSFGSQSKLKFLPEAQTDFIFAVISEQLGFLGVVLVVALFFTLFWRMVSIAKNADDNFGTYIVLGVLLVIFVQMTINIAMNIGLMPVTGLPLPLVSYGGSSMLATMIMLGLVQNIAMRRS